MHVSVCPVSTMYVSLVVNQIAEPRSRVWKMFAVLFATTCAKQRGCQTGPCCPLVILLVCIIFTFSSNHQYVCCFVVLCCVVFTLLLVLAVHV